MEVIPGEFQHALVIADIDKRKVRNVVRKTCAERRKMRRTGSDLKKKFSN